MTLWARVRDLKTGHQFDVSLARLETLLGRGVVVEVSTRQHKRHSGVPCLHKPRRPLGVGPSRRRKK